MFGFGLGNIFFDRWSSNLQTSGRNHTDYTAPEVQTGGMTTARKNGDIFSICRVTFELLLGRRIKNCINLLPSKYCNVAPCVDDALLNEMHGVAEKRPPSVSELRQWYTGARIREKNRSADTSPYDPSSTSRRPAAMDGQLSWVQSDWFRVSLALVVMAVLVAASIFFQRVGIDREVIPVLDEMALDDFHRQWEDMSEEELARLLRENPEHLKKLVETTYEVLTSADEMDEAEDLLEKVSEVADQDYEEKLQKWLSEISEMQDVRDIARQAFGSGLMTAREAALARAVELFPHNTNANQQYQTQATRLAFVLSKAMKQLKSRNPNQEHWHYQLDVTRDRVRLDLSGHSGLVDITALKDQHIHELDLSDTGIDSLRCVLGRDGDGSVTSVKPPLPDQRTWINMDGLKFRALPGRPVLLAEQEYRGPDRSSPLTSLTLDEARQICEMLTREDRASRQIGQIHSYRLPTDGEWSAAAQLPESQFLSPGGRLLQRLTPAGYFQHRRVFTALEYSPAPKPNLHGRLNGYAGLVDDIGEWVVSEGDTTMDQGLVRGYSGRDDFEKVRIRTGGSVVRRSRAVGFRPILELTAEATAFDQVNRWQLNSSELAELSTHAWKTPHLSAAALSAIQLRAFEDSITFREATLESIPERDPHANRYYLRVDLPMTWKEARATAAKIGGQLATATNLEHLAWLRRRYDSKLGTPLWIGASAPPGNQSWTWIDRKAVSPDMKPTPEFTSRLRGALLMPVNGPGEGPALRTRPTSERFPFLVQWNRSPEENVTLSRSGGRELLE